MVASNGQPQQALGALTSRGVWIASLALIVLAGAAHAVRDGAPNMLYLAVIVAYSSSALRIVADFTPQLLHALRPVVRAPDETVAHLIRRISGSWTNTLLKLIAPVFALGWTASIALRLVAGDAVESPWRFTLTEALMPISEVAFSLLMIWRMTHLARLSSQPLDVNLFDPRAVYPFGNLSFAYAAVISIRMVLQFLLFGIVQGGGMAVIFSIASVASLLALILPIWAVHAQMLKAKIGLLERLDGELNAQTRRFVTGERAPEVLAQTAAAVQSLGAMRDRIAARWTWPVPDSITAVQAVAISGAPTLLSVAKTYLSPLLGLG
jgi:hypothetical protein